MLTLVPVHNMTGTIALIWSETKPCFLLVKEAAGGFGEQSSDSMVARLILLIFLNGHLDMPCCLQMRFIVDGHTVEEELQLPHTVSIPFIYFGILGNENQTPYRAPKLRHVSLNWFSL